MSNVIVLSICIVSWNSIQSLKKCIESILNECSKIKKEIIVIDNNSDDETVTILEEIFPSVIIINNKENIGFGRAHNIGIKKCRGKYILILNPDMIVSKYSLIKMINCIEQDKYIGVLGCKLTNSDGSVQDSYHLDFPTLLSTFFDEIFYLKFFKSKRKIEQLEKTIEVSWLSGACLLFRGRVLKSDINGFNEIFFMYCEDVEICNRIKNKGLKVCYTNICEMIHFSGSSSSQQKRSYFSSVLQRESVFKYFQLTENNFVAFLYRMLWLIISIFRLFCLLLLKFPSILLNRKDNIKINKLVIKYYKILLWSLGFERWSKKTIPE